MPFEPRELTDPRTMRALAHPVRLALLEAIGLHGAPMTATEAAEVVGESPSSCSFHLRQLAKYGFVEEAEEAEGGAGRRRPWKLTHTGISFGPDPDADAETTLAANALERVMRGRFLARAQAALDARAALPPEWQPVAGTSQFTVYVTPEEAEAVQRDLVELLSRHHDRFLDASLRPEGARAVELVTLTYPLDGAG